jgi:glycosyltransferase involved in cell wall biosynthesis
MIKASIVIPTFNEEAYISSCLESIINSDIDKKSIEVLIVDGKSSDKTVAIVKNYMKKYPFIKILENKKKIIPVALNIGIKNAKGEYIIRIDAHSSYPKDYFSKLLYWSEKLDADNVGGICLTDVKNKNSKTNSIKAVMSHRFGVGGGDYRGTINKPKESNTVPFGCFKKTSLLKFGCFDERLERTEDLEINKRLIDNGANVYLVPDVSFTYYAKERLRDLAKKSFATGKWIVLNPYFTKSVKALHPHHFIPFLFVLSLILPLLFCPIDKIFCIITVLSLIFFMSAIFYFSYKLKREDNSFFYLIATFITLHISYGIGSLIGILEVVLNYIKGVQ